MKKHPYICIQFVIIGVVFLNFSVLAQSTGYLEGKAFGSHTNYSATLVTQIFDLNGNLSTEVSTHIAMLDGKVRTELTSLEYFKPSRGFQFQWKDGQIESFEPTGAWAKEKLSASLREDWLLALAIPGPIGNQFAGRAGMAMEEKSFIDRAQKRISFSIARPDKQLSYMVFPSINGYIDKPLPNGKPASNITSNITIETLGNEILDGHSCEKCLLTCAASDGRKLQFQVWRAADLENFPIQIKFQAEHRQNIIIKFKDVHLVNPDPKLFELPDNCVRYKNNKEVFKKIAAYDRHLQ